MYVVQSRPNWFPAAHPYLAALASKLEFHERVIDLLLAKAK